MPEISIDVKINPTLDAAEFNRVLLAMRSGLGDFGKTIQPIDASKFTASVASGLGDALKDTNKLKDGFEGLDEKIEGTGNKGKNVFEKLFNANQASQAIQGLASGITSLAEPFVALDTATQSMKTLGGEAVALAEPLRAAAIVMSQDLPFAAAELQTTMFDALASGVKGGEAGLKEFADTAAKLAVGGGSGINEATGLIAGQLNAYGKSAEEASKFADIFFNTVNYGVTSIPELSNTLSNVIPTASGLGIELENVGASLAVMTAKGIPTAQSTTKLNALLLELAKPGAALAPILKQAGVSLDSLKKDDLPVTLGKINEALKATGKASVEVFSSSEAGAAFASLASDITGFQQTFEDVRDTAGSAQNAYEQMSDSIGVKTKQAISFVESLAIKGFDYLGGSVVAAASTATQLAPLVSTVAGLGAIFPIDKIGGFASAMLQKLVPSLFTTVAANGITSVSFVGMGAAAASAWAAATGPAGLALLAIGAVVGGVILLYNYFDGFKKVVDEVFGYFQKVVGGIVAVFNNFFSDSGKSSGEAFKQGFESEANKMKLDNAIEAMKVQLDGAKDLNVEVDASINAESLVDDFQKTQSQIDAIKSKATTQSLTKDEQAQLDELVKKSEEAKAKLAELAPSAVQGIKTVTDANGNLKQVYDVNIEAANKLITAQSSATSGKVAEAQKKYSDGLNEQLGVYESQKSKLKELGTQITNTSDPTRVKALTAEYNKQQSELNNTKKALTDSFNEGGKAGLVTKSALEKVSTALQQNSAEAKKNFLAAALTEASAKGKLTDTQVAAIAKRYNTTADEAKALLKAQEQNTAEANNTSAAAKSIGDAYAESTKASKDSFQKAFTELEGLKNAINEASKNGDKVKVAELREQYKQQLAIADAANAELKAGEAIKKGLNDRFNPKEKEKKSALEKFEIEVKSYQNAIEQEKISREMLRISQGLSFNAADELEFSQKNTKEYERQVAELNKLKDSKASDAKATKEIAAKLEEVTSKLEQSKLNTAKVQFKIDVDERQLSTDLDRIDQMVRRKNLEANVKLNLAPESDLTLFDINALRDESAYLFSELNSVKAQTDTKYYAELKAKIAENENQIAFKKLELQTANDDLLLAMITNSYERERAVAISQAERTYRAKFLLAQGNQALEYNAYIEFLESKSAAEDNYLQQTASKSLNITSTIASSFVNAFSSIEFKQDDSVQTEAKNNIKAIESEVTALAESFKKRLIDKNEYVNKSKELEAKRIAEEQKLRAKELDYFQTFADSATKALNEIYDTTINRNKELLEALQNNSKAKIKLEQQESDKLIQISKAKTKGDLADEKKLTIELGFLKAKQAENTQEAKDIETEAYQNAALVAGASFATMLLDGENTLKAMVVASLDALQALVPVFSAQIAGAMLSSPNPANTATLGAAGLAAAAALTVAFTGLVAVAKASVQSFHTGGAFGIDRDKGGLIKSTQNTALVTYNEKGQEFFMNHIVTSKNLSHFEEINRKNISLEQYAVENTNIRNAVITSLTAPPTYVFKAVPIIVPSQASRESQLEAKIDELIKELKAKNSKSEIHNKLDLNVKFDKGAYMKDIQKQLKSKIRRM